MSRRSLILKVLSKSLKERFRNKELIHSAKTSFLNKINSLIDAELKILDLLKAKDPQLDASSPEEDEEEVHQVEKEADPQTYVLNETPQQISQNMVNQALVRTHLIPKLVFLENKTEKLNYITRNGIRCVFIDPYLPKFRRGMKSNYEREDNQADCAEGL